jgi:hypothetical protein
MRTSFAAPLNADRDDRNPGSLQKFRACAILAIAQALHVSAFT